MKRYKAGKAGFGDITHLKAKGLIPRMMEKESIRQIQIEEKE